MKYEQIVEGIFEKRLNRFIAEVSIDGVTERVHVKNTGRCKELLIPGVQVFLEYVNKPTRKTKYSLISVMKNNHLINIDSQAPNTVVFEAIQAGAIPAFTDYTFLKREVAFQSSRFDVYVEHGNVKEFIEVKGVTLENNGVAMFPDAPTTRGTKHVLELIQAVEAGYAATILFVLQMGGCHVFMPHEGMDPAFAEAIWQAQQKGVRIMAYDCVVTEDELILHKPVPIQLVHTTM